MDIKSISQEAVSGGLAAVFTTPVIGPMLYFKNMAQANQAPSKNVFHWYRGIGPFAASFIPAIAIQNAVATAFFPVLDKSCSALMGGVCSSLVVNPAEAVLIQQQKAGATFMETARRLRVYGLYRACHLTAMREGVFAGAYLAGVPLLQKGLEERGFSNWTAKVAAGIVVGPIAAGISQPIDTIKTQMQSDLSFRPKFGDFCRRSAFSGYSWRVGITIAAITLIPISREVIMKMRACP